ncbi:hypothetical protein SK355_11765 (plasmid) [Candidatus Fukatsuia symbiotica]|uniref:Uncharacterized protein n=1 Tax=Candidatus Fukatsuia symbiotica TaxID=1878942 RepID=A0A2Y9CKG4_9GAMM|nr:hypothetical protein [Candidatus Fukatsuia symbiotica]AWK15470.1 hypothetical protein CCS41_13590 [Candidatus Fukatsuia symbiotica]MEA9445852.1 hypothetical protein [Candidatus Fukatsuia symbiotica]
MKKTLKVAKKNTFKKTFSLIGKIFFWLFIWSRRIAVNVLHMSVYFGLSLLHVFRYLLFVLGGFYCLIHYNQLHGGYTAACGYRGNLHCCFGLLSWLDNEAPFHRLLFVRENNNRHE